MQDVSDKLLGQFVACLEQRLATRSRRSRPWRRRRRPSRPRTPEPDPGSSTGPGPASVEAAVGSEAAPAAAAPASPPVRSNVDRPAFVRASAGRANDDAIDLGATVLPVILKSYAPQLAVAAVALVVGILIGRRRR